MTRDITVIFRCMIVYFTSVMFSCCERFSKSSTFSKHSCLYQRTSVFHHQNNIGPVAELSRGVGEEEKGEEGRHCVREREWVSEVKVLGCAEEIEKLDFEERTALTLVTAELN